MPTGRDRQGRQRAPSRPSGRAASPGGPRAAARSSGPSGSASRGRITWVSGSPNRALHSSRTGPVRGEHQASVERATERGAAAGQLGQDRPVEALEQLVGLVGEVRQRAVGAHPAGVRAASPSPSRLWSRAIGRASASRPSHRAIRLASRPSRRSSTTTGPSRRPTSIARERLVAQCVADRHALARGQAVGLDHDARGRAPRARGA